MSQRILDGLDMESFWEKSEYADREYVDAPVTDIFIAAVEKQLRYRLPASYVELMRHQNGGVPARTCHRTLARTSWANDHVAITGIKAIGFDRPWSLCGELGSQQAVEEWGYPPIGIYFGDCPSAGHDMLCLDYRECGPTGEPCVVHVGQELDYTITFVAATFADFVRGLESEEAFDV